MANTRRIGTTDSATRTHLLDVAEQMLIEEGYAAVTSRRLGARAEVSAQLVHYYFRTMDDLFVEVFGEEAGRGGSMAQGVVSLSGNNVFELTAVIETYSSVEVPTR